MFSDALQDEFALRINKWKRFGFYVDIGSCGAYASNNTAAFDSLNWRGICIEMSTEHNESYKTRRCTLINEDALLIDYSKVFEHNRAPKIIDYLSLDIDEKSVDVLKIIPHDLYRFRCITIEHDAYLHGERYREEQRGILKKLGYHLFCSNVFVEQSGYEGKKYPFEDWWVDPLSVDEIFSKLTCDSQFPSSIINDMNHLLNSL